MYGVAALFGSNSICKTLCIGFSAVQMFGLLSVQYITINFTYKPTFIARNDSLVVMGVRKCCSSESKTLRALATLVLSHAHALLCRYN